MREMKNTGVPWIGTIPKDWNILHLKYCCVCNSGKEIPCEVDKEADNSVPVFGSGGVFKYTNQVQYNEESVLFGRKGTLGKPIYVNVPFWAVDTMYYLSFPNSTCPKFIFYLLNSFDWEPYITHTALPSIVGTDIINSTVAIPSIEEQSKISAFLDEKCSEIDSLITLQDDMIAKLQEYKQSVITEAVTRGLDSSVPMKDSGIEWIGEIPEHWELMRLNELGNYKRGPFGSALKVDSFVPKSNDTVKVYIQQNVIQRDHTLGDYYISPDFFESSMNVYEVTQGDLLVTCDGTIGEIYLLPFNAERGILSSSLMRMRMNETYLNVFYFIYLFDIVLKQTLHVNGNGAAMKHIPPFNIFKKIKLPIPAIEEQKEILSFLDHKCSEIDSLIDIKKQKIEALKEYKKSLIYECVTGKKEIA